MKSDALLSRRWSPLVGAITPLPVTAVAIAASWAPWTALIVLAVTVIVVALVLGRAGAFFAAFVSTAGFSVVANEKLQGQHAIGGREMAAMGALVAVALLFGREQRA